MVYRLLIYNIDNIILKKKKVAVSRCKWDEIFQNWIDVLFEDCIAIIISLYSNS